MNKGLALTVTVILFILIIFLIFQTNNVVLFWPLFFIPVLFAAYSFDITGALLASIIAVFFLIPYVYVNQDVIIDNFTFNQLLFEIIIGLLIMTVSSVSIGWYSQLLKNHKETVSDLSLVDAQTGLHNYGYFIDRISEEKKRADRFGSKLTFILIGLDFKDRISRRANTSVYSEMLRKLAFLFEREVRAIDILARYSKDDFAILLPNTGLVAGSEIAERILKAFEKFLIDKKNSSNKISLSMNIGIATYPEHAKDEISLVDKATIALLAAKDEGNEKIAVYSKELGAKFSENPA